MNRNEPESQLPLPECQAVEPWYKTAVFYQLNVRSFYDGNGDGVGDLPGLTAKLAYFEELGATALWLQPICLSPLRDDGYDIADYRQILPEYGTLEDFQALLAAAHKRGLKVITELVVNHTSDQHPWFQAARRAEPGSAEREFYVWSDTDSKYAGARIIFQDYEKSNWTWDPLANAFYWHRFFSHQPDLNFAHPPVRQVVLETLDFWFRLGVDGLRLDAIPYLYEREGTNCENLPETHAYLKELRRYVDERYPERMLLAEANQWPTDAVAYFGQGDECHTAFHFPVMPRLYLAVHGGDRRPITDILRQTPPIPASCQWLNFLRNHDELTLEMVTAEEREIMYLAYAADPQARLNLGIRRRLAPLLNNSLEKNELLHGLLFSLPGSPVLYYGDEIGMGDNLALPDRHGVRTPMQWNRGPNGGFSAAQSELLKTQLVTDPRYHFERVNVESQQADGTSLWRRIARLIQVRKTLPALAVGDYQLLEVEDHAIFAFLRRCVGQTVLVVLNLSGEQRTARLHLSRFPTATLRDAFDEQESAVPRDQVWETTLAPYGYRWLVYEQTSGSRA